MAIRVLLGEMTAMVGSALRGSLAGCDDIELVQPGAESPLFEEVDVIVLHETRMKDCPTMLKALVDASPIGVVAIGESGMAGNLYRLEHESWRFVTGGKHGLADAIRAAAKAA
jgi:hypothetical protein